MRYLINFLYYELFVARLSSLGKLSHNAAVDVSIILVHIRLSYLVELVRWMLLNVVHLRLNTNGISLKLSSFCNNLNVDVSTI